LATSVEQNSSLFPLAGLPGDFGFGAEHQSRVLNTVELAPGGVGDAGATCTRGYLAYHYSALWPLYAAVVPACHVYLATGAPLNQCNLEWPVQYDPPLTGFHCTGPLVAQMALITVAR